MEQKEIFQDVLKVFGVHVGAMVITFSNVEGALKIMSLTIAISYGLWKWRIDYLKNKKGK